MVRPSSVAAAQTIPRAGAVDDNVAQHARLVRAAAAEHAQVVVFPELSLTGYELGLAESLAFSETDGRLDPLLELASVHAMTLVVGAPARIGARLYIGAFILSPDRSVELYTKHYLGAFPASASVDGVVPAPEQSVFQAGDRSPMVRAGGATAAVAVCADTGRPAHAQGAADRGATTYLASMFVIPSELDEATARLRATATRHSMTVAFANYGGPTGGLAAAGRSAIWSRAGESLARLDGIGAGLAIASETDSGWRGVTVRLDGG